MTCKRTLPSSCQGRSACACIEKSLGRCSQAAVANLLALTDHQWSTDHWLVTAALKGQQGLPLGSGFMVDLNCIPLLADIF